MLFGLEILTTANGWAEATDIAIFDIAVHCIRRVDTHCPGCRSALRASRLSHTTVQSCKGSNPKKVSSIQKPLLITPASVEPGPAPVPR